MAIPKASERKTLRGGGHDDSAAIIALLKGEPVYVSDPVATSDPERPVYRMRRATLWPLTYGIFYDGRKIPEKYHEFVIPPGDGPSPGHYKFRWSRDREHGAFGFRPVGPVAFPTEADLLRLMEELGRKLNA